jgi:hypothetical protein
MMASSFHCILWHRERHSVYAQALTDRDGFSEQKPRSSKVASINGVHSKQCETFDTLHTHSEFIVRGDLLGNELDYPAFNLADWYCGLKYSRIHLRWELLNADRDTEQQSRELERVSFTDS